MVVYVLPDEVPAALWRKALTFAAEQELPVVFVVLPAHGASAKARSTRLRSERAGPGLRRAGHPVDADDAVAIYRVAQESIGRARTAADRR